MTEQASRGDISPEPSRVSGEESLVLQVLQEENGPLDVITISSRTRLSIERTLRVLDDLEKQKLVARANPEPVHERFTPSAPPETLQRA